MDPGLIELFVDGKEDGLPDAGRLDDLGLGSGSVVFMLFRLGWRWEECGSGIALSGEGLVATKAGDNYYKLVTGGSPMTEGRHYWEVELTTGPWPMIGAARPGLDHDKDHRYTNDAHLIDGFNGALYGNGKDRADPQGRFATGDRIGVLLDLDAGWMRLYRNGKRCGPGFTEGVTGPLVRAAQLLLLNDKMTVLPAAVAPEGAGEEGEFVDYSTYSLAQLNDACRAKGLPVGGTQAVLRARLEAADPPVQLAAMNGDSTVTAQHKAARLPLRLAAKHSLTSLLRSPARLCQFTCTAEAYRGSCKYMEPQSAG